MQSADLPRTRADRRSKGESLQVSARRTLLSTLELSFWHTRLLLGRRRRRRGRRRWCRLPLVSCGMKMTRSRPVPQKEVRRHALECHNAKAAVLEPPEGCFLQYLSTGSKKDSNEGLLHQMSSLGTALAEAHFLGRMLVLPDAWCIPGKHMYTHDAFMHIHGALRHRRCFAYNQLYDLGLLSTVIPSVAPTQVASLEKNRTTSLNRSISRSITSSRIRASLPCRANTTLLRLELPGYWFMRAKIVPGSSLRAALLAHVGAPCDAPCVTNRHFAQNMLRSGIFLAPRIKQAAAAIVERLGGASTYAAVRVRRGDRLRDEGVALGFSAAQRDNLTRPEGIHDMLSSFLPSTVSVVILSSEPADFFAPLKMARDRVFTSDHFSDLLAVHYISDSFALFAVELLVGLGAGWFVETFENVLGGFSISCLPATSLRSRIATECHKAGRNDSSCSISRFNVSYGGACIHQQVCSLVPPRCGTAVVRTDRTKATGARTADGQRKPP